MSAFNFVTNAQLRSEFVRALSVVEQTQLTMFRETPVKGRAELYADFQAVWSAREGEFASGADKDKLQTLIMRDLLTELVDGFNDPFANYISPEALTRYYQRRQGNFVGIGVKFQARTDAYPVMIGPLLGGPLEHAGIEPGDEIHKIGGIDQYGATSREIAASLRGEPGSEVLLRLSRDGRQNDSLLLAKRQSVALAYVRSEQLTKRLGYLRISRFGGKTHDTAAQHLQQLLDSGSRALLLDLRDNPGGSTRAARAVVSMLSNQSHVYSEQFKSGKVRRLKRHGRKLTDIPLAVLINERSMSSSEIVAGALKTSGRGTIVGAPTYGKGLIQRVFDLKAPLGGAIRTTIAVYATLDDVLIHGVGVVPDYYVPTARSNVFKETGSLNISDAARRFRRQLLETRIRERYDESEATRIIAQSDQQLARAKALLDHQTGQ